MSNLTSSIVKGFGLTIGRRAANSMLDSKTSSVEGWRFMGLSTSLQWKLIVIWLLGTAVVGNGMGIISGWMFFLFGPIPIIIILKYFERNKNNKKSLAIIEKIDLIVNEANSLGMQGLEGWESTRENLKGNIYGANKYLELSTKMLGIFKRTLLKYDFETTIKLCKGDPWIGMSEEHILHMNGEPTKIERESSKENTYTVYVYGNKYSGDVFKFEDGALVSFKDR